MTLMSLEEEDASGGIRDDENNRAERRLNWATSAIPPSGFCFRSATSRAGRTASGPMSRGKSPVVTPQRRRLRNVQEITSIRPSPPRGRGQGEGWKKLQLFPGRSLSLFLQFLISIIGLKHKAEIVPGFEVFACCQGNRSTVLAAAFDSMNEQAFIGVEAEVPFVRALDFRNLKLLPRDAVGRDGEATIQ
jgi:hypothetical protein